MKRERPCRILTAVPLCDGHDSAVMTVNLELVRHGVEVVYLGYHRSASDIVRAAIQEDVAAVGLSSYNGGHVEFFSEVRARLRRAGAADIGLFGGGGGTITATDARVLRRRGVDRIFFAGTPLDEIVRFVTTAYAHAAPGRPPSRGDRALARSLTLAENGARPAVRRGRPGAKGKGFVLGVTGAGGAGKSTLIDELVLRQLRAFPESRVGILCNDPSHADSGGALLGDRASMIHAQDDRVFLRQLAVRGNLRGIARALPGALGLLRDSGRFDLLFVESAGIGQDGDPFGDLRGRRLVDATLLVMTPHYGGPLQLQKTALLNRADFVALNKADLPAAQTARSELAVRLAPGHRDRRLVATCATRHADAGVEELFGALEARRGEASP